MGGKPTGVGDTTTEVVLEAAWFQPATVRRTSRRLGLISDSSYRYERRVDPGALLHARDRALELLIQLTGATISSRVLRRRARLPLAAAPITLRTKRLEASSAWNSPIDYVEKTLLQLGCDKVLRPARVRRDRVAAAHLPRRPAPRRSTSSRKSRASSGSTASPPSSSPASIPRPRPTARTIAC